MSEEKSLVELLKQAFKVIKNGEMVDVLVVFGGFAPAYSNTNGSLFERTEHNNKTINLAEDMIWDNYKTIWNGEVAKDAGNVTGLNTADLGYFNIDQKENSVFTKKEYINDIIDLSTSLNTGDKFKCKILKVNEALISKVIQVLKCILVEVVNVFMRVSLVSGLFEKDLGRY